MDSHSAAVNISSAEIKIILLIETESRKVRLVLSKMKDSTEHVNKLKSSQIVF